jgi:hypothetical protein
MKKSIYFSFIFLAFIVSSCKKEAGIGGKKTITGTVRYLDGLTGQMEIAAGASVMIYYGTTTASTNYDQQVLADADGKYHFDGLRKGDYYITASFTDSHGFIYSTAGYTVTIENKKDVLTLDIDLQ